MVVVELVGTVVVELEAIVDVELADGPVVLVVDELGVDDEVVVEAVVVEGDTGGTIVSEGGTVRTGSEVGVESPAAERLVVPPAHAAARRPIARTTAMTPATDRRPPMRPHRSGPVNIVDTQHREVVARRLRMEATRATGAAWAPVLVAESEGFEPSVTRRPQRLSRPPHSSALATFRR